MQDLQHFTQRALIGSYQAAVTLVRRATAFEFSFEKLGLFEQGFALLDPTRRDFQACPVRAQSLVDKPLAALSTVLAKQGEQGLLLTQCGFQFDQIAITQGCKLLINKLKELAGYADSLLKRAQ